MFSGRRRTTPYQKVATATGVWFGFNAKHDRGSVKTIVLGTDEPSQAGSQPGSPARAARSAVCVELVVRSRCEEQKTNWR